MRKVITVIYGLVDPRSDEVRYVGKTSQSTCQRLSQHLFRARTGRSKTPCGNWIREVQAAGQQPTLRVLHEVQEGENWRALEVHWAARYSNLVNAKKCGGGGIEGHRLVWTEELEAQLGVVADSVIAEQIGGTRKSVTYRRHKLRVAASYDRTRNTPPPAMGGHNRLDLPAELIGLLGTLADARLAAQFGMSKCVIQRVRRNLGIPAYGNQPGHSTCFSGQGLHPRWGTPCKRGGDSHSPEK